MCGTHGKMVRWFILLENKLHLLVTEYMPPEMIRGKAYNQAVDWWALGALIYEMVTGYPPFVHKNKTKLHHKILNEKVFLRFDRSCICIS
jgi:serine/threonine protein kinase